MIEETPIEQPKQRRNPAEHLKKYQWPKGTSGNPKGREAGTLSAVTRIKQMFKANPEDFDEFLASYLNDPANKKHLVEMLDGKPYQSPLIEAKVVNKIQLTDEQLERIINNRRREQLTSGESS
jgi:hypothetical protein